MNGSGSSCDPPRQWSRPAVPKGPSRPADAQVKHRYLEYLTETNGYAEASSDGFAKALARFENYTRYRDFKSCHPGQAKGFKAHII
jgi:hypothetical protein